jgi:hypothetical protein
MRVEITDCQNLDSLSTSVQFKNCQEKGQSHNEPAFSVFLKGNRISV